MAWNSSGNGNKKRATPISLRCRRSICIQPQANNPKPVEFDLLGTNLGEFYGMPPTGKAFRVPVIAVFSFSGDRITNERIYFDAATLVNQIGRGELLAEVHALGQR